MNKRNDETQYDSIVRTFVSQITNIRTVSHEEALLRALATVDASLVCAIGLLSEVDDDTFLHRFIASLPRKVTHIVDALKREGIPGGPH